MYRLGTAELFIKRYAFKCFGVFSRASEHARRLMTRITNNDSRS